MGIILCSVLNWRTPSHYIFIRQLPAQQFIQPCALLLQAYITHIRFACKLCAQPRDAHSREHAQDYFCVWINTSLIIAANLVLNKVKRRVENLVMLASGRLFYYSVPIQHFGSFSLLPLKIHYNLPPTLNPNTFHEYTKLKEKNLS